MVYQIGDGVNGRASMADIAVTDDGVYTIGYINDDDGAWGYLWKNNEVYGEFLSPTGYMNPSSLLAYNNELYTSGYYYNNEWCEEGFVWKKDQKFIQFETPNPDSPEMLPDAMTECMCMEK